MKKDILIMSTISAQFDINKIFNVIIYQNKSNQHNQQYVLAEKKIAQENWKISGTTHYQAFAVDI